MEFISKLGGEIVDKQRILDQIVERVNHDETGISRLLQANPDSRLPRRSFDGIITEEVFLTHLYFESKVVEEHKKRLSSFLSNGDGRNTVFILGYQGCGKTTFVSSLLNYYRSEKGLSSSSLLRVDCDAYGVTSDNDPLKSIFIQSLLSFLKSCVEPFEKFVLFFDKNVNVLTQLTNYRQISAFRVFIDQFIREKKNINNIAERDECLSWFVQTYAFKDVFYILFMFLLSNVFREKESTTPIVVFIDDLDSVDEHETLRSFITAVDDFTIDMSGIFHDLCIYEDAVDRYQYTDKIKIVIAMRETTRAALPSSHFSDIFNDLYTHYDITDWQDKHMIAQKRLDFLRESPRLSPEKQYESRCISNIMLDSSRHTTNVFTALFNNNYRKTINAITLAVKDHKKQFDDYNNIMGLDKQVYRYGARGILFKLIIDNFIRQNYFKEIGVLDLLGHTTDISIARLVLSYLSNYTDTGCGNNRHHPLRQLLQDFKDAQISDPCNIMQIVQNMYNLENAKWSHLISFSQLDYIDNKNINPETSSLHYTCAGKIFLETVTTHFEFFSSRMGFNQQNEPRNEPLFCKSNRIKDSDGKYKFVNVIETIFNEVAKCCESLRVHNKKVCLRTKYPDPYKYDIKIYHESPFIAQISKSSSGKRMKQFHEERIIDSHIGYIDVFRKYILNETTINVSEKIEINKILHRLLEKYVRLLESDVVLKSNNHLLSHFKNQLNLIKKDFKNFDIAVNKESYSS
jgi:energy-coupling factor transporter ATP-binding protein EcfA2